MKAIVAVILSFLINWALIGYSFYLHPSIHLGLESSELKEILGILFGYLFIFCFISLPWLIGLAIAKQNKVAAAFVFATIATISSVFFFVPPPIHPSEAIGYTILTHSIIVYVLSGVAAKIGKSDE